MYIIVKDGRGKTGTAKTGPVRMLFADNAQHDKFDQFIRKCYATVENPIPYREFFNASYTNLLGKDRGDCWTFESKLAGNLTLINERLINRGMTPEGVMSSIQEN